MQPQRTTAADLLGVQEELIAREPIFHRSEFGVTRAGFEAMMAEEFWETGASGQRYGKQFVLDTLEERYAQPHDDQWETSDFYCQQIATDNFLLTYTLRQGARITQRATLWRRQFSRWLIVYHQGTVVVEV